MAAAQEAQKKLNHKLKFKEPFFGQQMEKALQHNGVIGLAKPLTLSWLQTTKDLKMSAPGGAELCTFCRIRLHSSKLLFFFYERYQPLTPAQGASMHTEHFT